MKKLVIFFLGLSTLFSCSSDNDEQPKTTSVTINFTHSWEDTPVTSADFNDIKFTNEHGEELSIERLRYIISNIHLTSTSGPSFKINDYLLVDLGEEQNLTFTTETTIPNGTYNLAFTFGFTDEDNQDGIYLDLNSTSFNVPMMMGGGYHYMQFDGKFIDVNDAEVGFNYHAIRAVDNSDPDNLILKDTSFGVTLSEVVVVNNTATMTVNMNIAEWFKNPNEWDLNQLNQMLMPNYEAQLLMSENGKTVFSLQ
ncbi:MbnP family protein [Tenacibaculum sp. IB213877]|uniref:MbnP family protein n=1 Tax=Tenacibaculum sp. IB213877 TaxID=3097351 RepID=UPI002A5A7EF4|nr:MbnP family protein [Tenacibaculum sp. IB213877]MDY0780644.1 MbnP family protein [Tenacibaculum sp. IB213877]